MPNYEGTEHRPKNCDVKTTFRKQNSSAGSLVPSTPLVQSRQSLKDRGVLGFEDCDVSTFRLYFRIQPLLYHPVQDSTSLNHCTVWLVKLLCRFQHIREFPCWTTFFDRPLQDSTSSVVSSQNSIRCIILFCRFQHAWEGHLSITRFKMSVTRFNKPESIFAGSNLLENFRFEYDFGRIKIGFEIEIEIAFTRKSVKVENLKELFKEKIHFIH